MSSIPFRVTDGLDAAGQKIVNVGYPDINSKMDGVSVDFFVQENTIQLYDATRTYDKNFAVIYDNRIYLSQVDITSPEAFNPVKWKPVRTDPSWKLVTTNAPALTNLSAGDHILAQTISSDVTFTLPTNALNGDVIVIRDNGSNLHDYTIDVSGNGRTISGLASYKITAKNSSNYFILNGSEWFVQTEYAGDVNKSFISNKSYPAGGYYKSIVGDQLMRETRYTGGIKIQLPKFARNGDTITTYDLDGNNPVTKTTVNVHPGSSHNIIVEYGSTPMKTVVFDSTDWGMFVFDSSLNAWRVFDSDNYSRWKSVKTSTYFGQPNDRLVVYTETPSTVNITFPRDAARGDSFFIDTRYMKRGSTLTLNIDASSTNDFFVPDGNTLMNPRISSYRDFLANMESKTVKTQSFDIQNRGEQWEFVYFTNALGSGKDVWSVVTMSEIPYRVDRNVPEFYGMAAIASQSSVNKNKEDITTGQNPDCEDFVTAETLANKVSTLTNRGIIRISTDSESKATSGSGEPYTSTVITPERLNNRLSTTNMRGVMRTATQAQADARTGSGETWDRVAITPATLNGRDATESLTGLSALVSANGTKPTTRTTPGTGVYDYNDHSKVITPKTLFEKNATEFSQGMVYIANQGEVNTGAADTATGALVITATTLEGRQATASLTGLSRAATSAEVLNNTPPTGDNVHVSVKGLVSRTATETRWGLSETATQAEVDAGTLHDKWFVTPKTFGNWLVRERLTVSDVSGLRTVGNIWEGQSFNIVVPTELQRGTARIATQNETNDMTGTANDEIIVTPKKLSARLATTTQTGLSQIATQSEVDTGTNNTKYLTPLTALTSSRNSAGYRMTDTRYGVGITAILSNNNSSNSVFEGNDILGSTRALSGYAHGDVLVSPRGLNTALANFLPLKAVAVSASAMEVSGNRIPSSDWVRRTISQTITGAMTFTENPVFLRDSVVRLDMVATNGRQDTAIMFKNNTNKNWWASGVHTIDGGYQISTITNDIYNLKMNISRDGDTNFYGSVSNGGQDPTSGNHLVRFAYAEERYVRGPGNFAETITGSKTFVNHTYFKNSGSQNIWMGNTSKSGITINANESLNIGSLGGLQIRPNGISSSTNTSSFESNGDLKVSAQVKIGSALPIDPDDAIRKDYLDSVIDDMNTTSGSRVFKGGDTMTGELIINSVKALTVNGDSNLNGTTTVNKLRIAVGNGEFLEIRANPTTKSVDFVWIS